MIKIGRFYLRSSDVRPGFVSMSRRVAGSQSNYEQAGASGTIILWDDDQPEFGPVLHRRANFKDLNPPVVCTLDKRCRVCRETREYNERRDVLPMP